MDIHHKEEALERDPFSEELKHHGLLLNNDGYIRWDKQNPKHPRNWSGKRKAYNTVVILCLEFITTAVSTAGTSASAQAQADYGISPSFSVFAFTSMYLIGQGIGGVFFPPYSETFGRKTLYIASTLGYCAFCAIVASVPSLVAVFVARLITGFLSAIPTIVVAGSIEDVFNMRARVWMIFIWALTGNVAVCIGPIYSTYVTFHLGWRWVFYIATIITGVLFVLCLWLKESRPSLLLEREVATLRKALPHASLKTLNPDHTPDFKTLVRVTLARPLRLLFTEPIIIMVAIMGSVTCALYYLFAEALLVTFEAYGWPERQASLSFIPVAIGCLCGFFPRLYDSRVLADRQKRGKPLEPENKLFSFALAAPTLAGGLWWFGWTIPPLTHVHWIVPLIALVPVGFALNEFVYTLTGYLADSYTIYAASGFAGLILARASTCAVVLPFTHQMYINLGPNVATSILASVATVFCVAPFVFFKYGKRIREASVFARYSLTTYRDNQVEDDMNDTSVVLFLTTLGTGSLGRIEKKLESIIEEIRSGKREPSILTTSGDDDAEAEVQWDALKSELVEDGFTKQDVESHKHSIMAHLQQLIDNGELQESVPQTKQRNPNFTSSRKRQETKTQQSNYQHPDVREDDSGSGPEDDDFSSGSEVSTISVHSSSTADVNRARLIPTIDPTNQRANRVSKDDAENLSPLKSGADSPSTREPEILAPQENKGLETEGWDPSSVDPSSFKRKNSINGRGPGIRQNQLSSNPHPVVRNVASPPPQHPHPPLSDSDDSDDETLESDRAYYRKRFGHSRDNDFFQKGWTPHRGPTGLHFLNPGNSFAEFPRSGRDRLPEAKIVENPLPLSLEDLFGGTKKKMRFSRRLSDKPGDERREDRILEMDIKPGLKAGSKFKFNAVGDLENGQYQDIHFIVTEKPHPVFTRDQHDIHATIELSLEEALTGWGRKVGTIDGKYVPFSRAGPTPPGHQVTFPGLGMPKSKSQVRKGTSL